MSLETKNIELSNAIKKAFKSKRKHPCLATDEARIRCSKTAIGSHTIQKGAGLKAIAENGHVYQVQAGSISKNNGSRTDFHKVGHNLASVFSGFCAEHDNGIFQELERETGDIGSFDMRLLGYRTICMELFKKERTIQIFNEPRVRKLIEELGAQRQRNGFISGTRLAIADLNRQKNAYEAYFSGDRSVPFYASYFEMDRDLPFSFASGFAPEYDFVGNFLLPPPDQPWGSGTVYVGRVKGRPIASFQLLDTTKHHNVAQFFHSQHSLDMRRVGGLFFQFAIEYSENAFFKMSWIDNMLPELKADFLTRFRNGTPGVPNRNKASISSQADIVRVAAKEFHQFPPRD
ncbi:hypothetical protein [Celeribacter marinus]|uniref:hypothetical protein n=1 Tax=Celeribacter marinus TaxID=1397108 RepID=UPI003F6C0595